MEPVLSWRRYRKKVPCPKRKLGRELTVSVGKEERLGHSGEERLSGDLSEVKEQPL